MIVTVLAAIIYYSFFYEKTDYKSYSCQYYYNVKESNFNGVVNNKFISTYDHSLRKIVVNSETIILDFKLRSVYKFIEVGDSVYLEKDSDTLKIFRNNEIAHKISIAELCPAYLE